MDQHDYLIATADARRAALFSCRRAPGGRVHVSELGSLRNSHEGEHEQQRPTLLGRASGRAVPHTVSPGHTVEEETSRFAKEVGSWLGDAAGRLESKGKIRVFAPPRFLGLLRGVTLDKRIELREGEFTRLGSEELAAHPAVLEVLGG